jgi:predicted  nucleic acid-binding Zn-ribbon protein
MSRRRRYRNADGESDCAKCGKRYPIKVDASGEPVSNVCPKCGTSGSAYEIYRVSDDFSRLLGF